MNFVDPTNGENSICFDSMPYDPSRKFIKFLCSCAPETLLRGNHFLGLAIGLLSLAVVDRGQQLLQPDIVDAITST